MKQLGASISVSDPRPSQGSLEQQEVSASACILGLCISEQATRFGTACPAESAWSILATIFHSATEASQMDAEALSSTAADVAPSVFFFTRRINDPTLIPSLLAAGVKFAAIQVNLDGCSPSSSVC